MTTKRVKRVVKALSFMFRGVSNEWRRKGRGKKRILRVGSALTLNKA